MNSREFIQHRIDLMRKSIDIQLAYGDSNEANRLRDQIGELERQIQRINEQKER